MTDDYRGARRLIKSRPEYYGVQAVSRAIGGVLKQYYYCSLRPVYCSLYVAINVAVVSF